MFIKKTFFKLLRLILTGVLLNPVFPVESQIFLKEGFEAGAKPEGWTEEFISGTEPWRFRNGGHSPNDNNWLVPPAQKDITRNPPLAYEGLYNAIFFKQGDNNERTMLVTPAMNLLGGADIELSFYLCQVPWTFEGSQGWDVLRVWYKVSESSPWVLLHEYLDPVYSWTQQTLLLPNASSSYYIGFEGQTRWGYGTCIDNISIESKGIRPYWIKEIGFRQLFPKAIPSGTSDVPVMRIDFTLLGNSGTAILDHIRFNSLNTSDNDIKPNGVKLYSTATQTFSTANRLGSPISFSSGIAEFAGLNHVLPPGQSYLWLTYDINSDVTHGDILDAKVSAAGILANDTLYPSVEISPDGYRVIHETQYFENFEGIHNWTLDGEFEVGPPSGNGGSPGNPDPAVAYSGSRVLGTDLTGLGSHPYNYEPNIGEAASYTATSPTLNLFYYKNLNIFFQRYLNIEVWDNSSIQVSADDGSSWHTIWKNSSYVNDFQWTEQQIPIPDAYSRTDKLKIRYQLGPTDVQNSYSGWNIDDIYLTGEFITRDAGVSEWIYPLSGTGHTSSDSVKVRITNYGGAEITDPVPVAYSFDGGTTWTTNIMDQNIPVGGSVIFTFPARADLSVPGPRSAMAKTILQGDQYTANDKISIPVYIVPTFKPPYYESFESNDGFWRKGGNEIWEHGTPAGSIINSASSGIKSWVTGLNQSYENLITRKNKIIFQDDFEFDLGWTYSGEFERNIPDYQFLPYFAYSGYHCIGTDLSGKGIVPNNYENGISPASAYTATSPSFNTANYSNLTVSFSSWITIQQGDSLKLEISSNNGLSWKTLWKNAGAAILEDYYSYRQFSIPDSLGNTGTLKFRFSLYSTSSSGPVAQGWSIDDFLLTGDLVNTADAYLVSPAFDLRGIINPLFEAHLWCDTEQGVDGATLQYSLDEGTTWTAISNSSAYDSYWKWYTGKYVSALASEGWSGKSNGWMTVRHLLPPALLNKPSVQFRIIFKADKANNLYDGVAIDDIRIIEAPNDLGVAEILAPVSSCDIGADQKFTLRLKNYSIRNLLPGDSVRIGYYLNNSGQVQASEETVILAQVLPQGAAIDLTMASVFDFSRAGQYQVRVFTVEDDPLFYHSLSNDSVYRLILVKKPLLELGPDISTVTPEQVVLKAFSGVHGNSYLWQDGSVDSVYHVSVPGKYWVRVTNDIGCTASDTINIFRITADIGVRQLVSPLSSCVLGNKEYISINIVNFGPDTLSLNDTIPLVSEINSELMNMNCIIREVLVPGDTLQYTFPSAYDFSDPGIYRMKVYTRFRNDMNHSNDTLNYTLELFDRPSVDLGGDIIAQAPEYVLSAPSGYPNYLWQDGSGGSTFTVNRQGTGLYYVSVTDQHQCTNTDSVSVTLNVTDLSLTRIVTPSTGCSSSDSLTVSVRLKNAGNMPVLGGQRIRLSYNINNGPAIPDSLLLPVNLSPGDSMDFMFRRKVLVIKGQWYTFNALANFATDMRSANNSLSVPVGVFVPPVVNLGDDYRIIAATSYVLDAGAGFSSYLWQDGSSGRNFTVKTPGINNCSVIVKDDNGCTASDQISIMLAVPDAGITEILNPVSACGSAIPKNVRVAIKNLGNWDIDKSAKIAVTYSINGGTPVRENIILNSVFQKGSVIYHTFTKEEDFTAAGHYSIVSTLGYESDLVLSNNVLSATYDVLESPVTDIGKGRDTIITYQPLTLSANPGYTSYKWQDGSTGTSYTVGQPGAAMYRISVTGSNSCITHDSVCVIYDVPDAGITGLITPVSSCKAIYGEKKISAGIINNGYYRISKNDGLTMSYSVNEGNPVQETVFPVSTIEPGKSGVVTFAKGYDFSSPGSFNIRIRLEKNDNNLSNNALLSTVIIRNIPQVEIGGGKDTIRNVTLPVTLTAGSGYASYTWQDNSTGDRLTARDPGLYHVTVSDEYGCYSSDSVFIYADIQKFPGNIKIFPNPVSDILHVLVDMESAADFRILLYDLVNKLIYREDFRNTSYADKVIDAGRLAPGTYILQVISGRLMHTSLVVVY